MGLTTTPRHELEGGITMFYDAQYFNLLCILMSDTPRVGYSQTFAGNFLGHFCNS